MKFSIDNIKVRYDDEDGSVLVLFDGETMRLDFDSAISLHQCLSDLIDEIS